MCLRHNFLQRKRKFLFFMLPFRLYSRALNYVYHWKRLENTMNVTMSICVVTDGVRGCSRHRNGRRAPFGSTGAASAAGHAGWKHDRGQKRSRDWWVFLIRQRRRAPKQYPAYLLWIRHAYRHILICIHLPVCATYISMRYFNIYKHQYMSEIL